MLPLGALTVMLPSTASEPTIVVAKMPLPGIVAGMLNNCPDADPIASAFNVT